MAKTPECDEVHQQQHQTGDTFTFCAGGRKWVAKKYVTHCCAMVTGAAGVPLRCDVECENTHPYCAHHAAEVMGLEVRKSTLCVAGAGDGLFAVHAAIRRMPHRKRKSKAARTQARKVQQLQKTPVFFKDQFIAKYSGEYLTEAELHERYTEHKSVVAPYVVQLSVPAVVYRGPNLERRVEAHYVDSALKRSIAAMANCAHAGAVDLTGAVLVNNAYLCPRRGCEMWIKAARDIFHGEEVLLNYGDEYFGEPVPVPTPPGL